MTVLPNVSFIRLPGTPIEQNETNTRAVFGEDVSVYDIQRAVIDKATVPISYESRIATLSLNEAELPKVDFEFEDVTEGPDADNTAATAVWALRNSPEITSRFVQEQSNPKRQRGTETDELSSLALRVTFRKLIRDYF